MGQASPYLRRGAGFWTHWCPGCREPHAIFDSWSFSGDVNRPHFSPSVAITGVKQTYDEKGDWEWPRDADGKAIPHRCHYHLWDGRLHFCADSNHALAGQVVDLPELPPFMRDGFAKPWPHD